MKINIPCPYCGCQHCEAVNEAGQKVTIEICRCNDGSAEFEVSIIPDGTNDVEYEKHQCSEAEIENCINTRFKIDLDSISHQCHN